MSSLPIRQDRSLHPSRPGRAWLLRLQRTVHLVRHRFGAAVMPRSTTRQAHRSLGWCASTCRGGCSLHLRHCRLHGSRRRLPIRRRSCIQRRSQDPCRPQEGWLIHRRRRHRGIRAPSARCRPYRSSPHPSRRLHPCVAHRCQRGTTMKVKHSDADRQR